MKHFKTITAVAAAATLGFGSLTAPAVFAQTSEPYPYGSQIPIPGTSETCTLGESGSSGSYQGGVKRFFQYECSLYEKWTNGNCSDIQDAIFGEDGQDGEDGRGIANVTMTEDYYLIITYTDGTVSSPLGPLPKGDQGDQGGPGQDGESVTVEDWYVDSETGETVVKFSDDTEVRIPKGEQGEQGLDGESVTVEDWYVDSETGETVVEFSDDTEIRIPKGAKGDQGERGPQGPKGDQGEQGQDGADGKSAYEIWLDNGHEGTEEDFLEWLKGLDGADGQDGADGKSAYEIWLDNGNEGTEQDFLEWLRGEDGKDGKDGEFNLSSGSSGSSNNPRCTAAIATVGIPLLALSPLALATQVNIPGLSPLVASAQAELQNFNTNLQQQSGIYDPNTANFMAQVNAELNKSGVNIGQVAGAAVLLTVGGLALKHVVDNCLPA